MEYQRINHEFEPVYNSKSKQLILGSFPSVKSRELGFYYSHPRNRFWKVLSEIYNETLPTQIQEKKEFLFRHEIAVWDVIEKCDIIGSSDSSIKNVVPADINRILLESEIKIIYANGQKAYELYQKYCYQTTKQEIIKLPSTSPANAAWKLEDLISAWSCLKQVK